jgi:hypothetical protein
MSSTHTGQRQPGAQAAAREARTGEPDVHTPRGILARLDRIDVWSMPFLFVGIIGLGFMFAFFDVFDINVSFIQSCVALKPGATCCCSRCSSPASGPSTTRSRPTTRSS